MWAPIPKTDLENLILSGFLDMNDQERNFWDMVKIEPEKWIEDSHGSNGGGFWVVAIFGREVIWYNDIEDGFNVSKYDEIGIIKNYQSNQSELNHSIKYLMDRINEHRFND